MITFERYVFIEGVNYVYFGTAKILFNYWNN